VGFGFGSSTQDFSSLGKHVEIQLRKYWDVGEHCENHGVLIVECKIERIWHGECPQILISDVLQGIVHANQFPRNPNWVQDNK